MGLSCESLLAGYRRVRAATAALAAPLQPEDQVVQTMPEVSPTKWHLAHTTWFFETFVLRRALPGYRPIDDRYGYIFNSYYIAAGERHPQAQRGVLSRPTVAQVGAYRQHVDHQLERLLADGPAAAVDPHAATIELGLHHEQQHQELLLTDIKHVFATNPLEPVYAPSAPHPRAGAGAGWLGHLGGLVDIGHAGAGFAFDNESPRHRVHLEPFALARQPVSCGDWLSFIAEGGYRRAELWLSDGWEQVARDGWQAPLYWRPRGAGWEQYTLAGWRAVDPAEPACHLSFYEADAFARWAGARLPREAEWEAVAAAEPALGGQVWEWTASSYAPYPGFRPLAGALGEYNGKFMSNRMVLRGGSCATPPGHSRSTYRNFFTPDTRWQFSGLRLARPA